MQTRPSKIYPLERPLLLYTDGMNHHDISDKDRQAIEKKELNEFEQRRLRGTGYDMMVNRDRGWGVIHDELTSNDVVLEWHVEDEKRYPMQVTESSDGNRIEVFPRKIPADCFVLKIGKEEAIIKKEAFQKLFRWV